MVERGTEGLLAVQRQVAAVQASGEQGLLQTGSELRQRLEEVHQSQQRNQDLLQVMASFSTTTHPLCPCPVPLLHLRVCRSS